MTDLIKFGIELIAMFLIWIAVDYKRKDKFTPFINKEWWVQFILIVIAVVIVKNLYKYQYFILQNGFVQGKFWVD